MTLLIEQIKNGDEKAVLKFYKLFSSKIRDYLINRLKQKEDADELLNEVFLDAIDALPFFEERSHIQTWLYKIARNKIVDFYRKRRIKSIFLSQIPFLQIVVNEINQPEFQFEKNKIRDGIELALHSLSLKYQKILKLRYEEKIPVKILARKLNLSFKATESLLFRARQSFKLAYERATIS
jgi:RNA polymerase sigma-70 factor, ECF subfamily